MQIQHSKACMGGVWRVVEGKTAQSARKCPETPCMQVQMDNLRPALQVGGQFAGAFLLGSMEEECVVGRLCRRFSVVVFFMSQDARCPLSSFVGGHRSSRLGTLFLARRLSRSLSAVTRCSPSIFVCVVVGRMYAWCETRTRAL